MIKRNRSVQVGNKKYGTIQKEVLNPNLELREHLVGNGSVPSHRIEDNTAKAFMPRWYSVPIGRRSVVKNEKLQLSLKLSIFNTRIRNPREKLDLTSAKEEDNHVSLEVTTYASENPMGESQSKTIKDHSDSNTGDLNTIVRMRNLLRTINDLPNGELLDLRRQRGEKGDAPAAMKSFSHDL